MNSKKYIALVFIPLLYALGYMFAPIGMPYVGEWMASNRFFLYIGMLAILLYLVRLKIISYLLTIGFFVGIFIGEFLGDYLEHQKIIRFHELLETANWTEDEYLMHKARAYYQHPGIFICFGVVLLFLFTGIILHAFKRNKTMRTEGGDRALSQ